MKAIPRRLGRFVVRLDIPFPFFCENEHILETPYLLCFYINERLYNDRLGSRWFKILKFKKGNMTHPIIESLLWRHTTKKYDASKKISEEDLGVLFEAMRLSPSSINSQPWKFIVIESDDARQRMSQTFANKFQFNQAHVFDSSQIILFAHNPRYTKDDFAAIIDKGIEDKRTKQEDRERAFALFAFAELNTDEAGSTDSWTKAQTYLALGNTLHTLARLKIDSTALEGIDTELVNEEFKKELDGYRCDVALAIGYHDAEEDYNAKLPKSRRNLESILVRL